MADYKRIAIPSHFSLFSLGWVRVPRQRGVGSWCSL
uniref:Uncharacterized protein n=1 Tax=Anguilla anguilla TaxID=7936 RepID=A0A0E9RKM7_ANGAN